MAHPALPILAARIPELPDAADAAAAGHADGAAVVGAEVGEHANVVVPVAVPVQLWQGGAYGA